ncbi:hypothetical protein [Paenibacillus sp. FSL H8-0034]|uniref:hypothetical protein n=1 Tax=Paenibacillus sp. FSL H8-0034 TaxID=2954671 RepID=UPI0030F55922
MNKKKTFLFFGFGEGSEYVLKPLYEYMVKNKHYCIEIDMMKTLKAKEIIKSLRGKDIVFITSAHLFMDQKNFSPYYQDGEIISALEVIEYLKPVKCIYYPHDLVTPVLPQDLKWLSLFDVFLSPLPNLSHLRRYSDVIEVGWIKKTKETSSSDFYGARELRVAFSMSSIGYYFRLGYEKTYDVWEPLFKEGIGIKLPFWPGVKPFEEFLAQKGVTIYPSNMNIFDLIDNNDVIVTNTTTSVTIEAALSGRMVLNVLDGVVTEREQRDYAMGLPSVSTCSLEDCITAIRNVRKGLRNVDNYKQILRPFNFELASQILLK